MAGLDSCSLRAAAHADTGAGFDIDVRLFLFIITAARQGDDSRPGRRTVLVFSRGLQIGDAVDSAIDQVDALGWGHVELQAAKDVTDDIATEADALARDAMERALADGFSHLVY